MITKRRTHRPYFAGRTCSRPRLVFSANLALDGSTVLIQAESVAKFQGDLLVLDHGSVSVGTSKTFKVRGKLHHGSCPSPTCGPSTKVTDFERRRARL